jgi:hypothetical protein
MPPDADFQPLPITISISLISSFIIDIISLIAFIAASYHAD